MREDVRLPFLRRNKFFDSVGEKDESDLIVVVNRRECQNGADFRCDFVFHAAAVPKFSERLRSTSSIPSAPALPQKF